MKRTHRSAILIASLSAACVVATTGSAFAAEPAAKAETSAATATASSSAPANLTSSISTYTSQVAAVFTQSTLTASKTQSSKSSPTPSVAVQETAPIADAVRAGGDTVTSAKVSSKVLSTTTDKNGTITVLADITTVLTVADDGSGNTKQSWSDTHRLKLVPSGTGYTVTTDENLPAPADDTGTATSGTSESASPQAQSDDLKVPSKAPRVSDATPPTRSAQNSALASQKSAAVTPMAASSGYPTENRIDTSKFRSYGITYTSGKYDGNEQANFNPKYPYNGNNCANFASQVLNNAGWYLTGGSSFDVENMTKWTYNLGGVAGQSRTWSQASSLYTFADNTGTYRYLPNIWNARTGDLLFADWDPNGKADGKIDHVMVVTGSTSSGDPLISQKSSSRSNINLHTSQALAAQQGKTSIVWYGLNHI